MDALAAWLRRLTDRPADRLDEYKLRVFVPGAEPLDLNNWLLITEPAGEMPPGRGSAPEAVSILRFLDRVDQQSPVEVHQRLALDLATAFSIALERRIDIPHELAVRVQGTDTITMVPYGQAVDRTVLGPLPEAIIDKTKDILTHVSGLEQEDAQVIGSAASMYHGALLLFDRDVRSAYTLLVAGIEVLSRKYGAPPGLWTDWEDSERWDDLFNKVDLTVAQSAAIRQQLLENRQLRLKATFRAYGAGRLPQSFWNRQWHEWTYGVDVKRGSWTPPTSHETRTVRDILPEDREALGRMLGLSYDLRSKFVHRGVWIGPFDLTLRHKVQSDAPLPFSVLRAVLRELVDVELRERSQPAALPDVEIRRSRTHGNR